MHARNDSGLDQVGSGRDTEGIGMQRFKKWWQPYFWVFHGLFEKKS